LRPGNQRTSSAAFGSIGSASGIKLTRRCAKNRAGIVDAYWLKYLHPPIKCDSGAICESGGRFEATPYGLIVKGKRISCPPHYAPPNNDYDPPHHDYEHGFPLIRSLRASTPRPTSVLFSFVLSLLIVAGSPAIRQSKTIRAQS
jgi:hypothetical protein